MERGRSSSSGAKRASVTIAQKLAAVKSYNAKEETVKQIASRLSVSAAAVATWMKKPEEYWAELAARRGSSKRVRREHYPKVNEVMLEYLHNDPEPPLSPELTDVSQALLVVAQEIADDLAKSEPSYRNFKPNNGWLHALLKRNGFSLKKLDADYVMRVFHQQLVATGVFDPRAIFMTARTTLFYDHIPNFADSSQPSMLPSALAKNNRVTLIMCANGCGDKVPLLVEGEAQADQARKPRDSVIYHRKTRTGSSSHTSVATSWFKNVFIPRKRALLGTQTKAILVLDPTSMSFFSYAHAAGPSDIIIMSSPPACARLHTTLTRGIPVALKQRYKHMLFNKVCQSMYFDPSAMSQPISNTIRHPASVDDCCELLATIWNDLPLSVIASTFCNGPCSAEEIQDALLASLSVSGRMCTLEDVIAFEVEELRKKDSHVSEMTELLQKIHREHNAQLNGDAKASAAAQRELVERYVDVESETAVVEQMLELSLAELDKEFFESISSSTQPQTSQAAEVAHAEQEQQQQALPSQPAVREQQQTIQPQEQTAQPIQAQTQQTQTQHTQAPEETDQSQAQLPMLQSRAPQRTSPVTSPVSSHAMSQLASPAQDFPPPSAQPLLRVVHPMEAKAAREFLRTVPEFLDELQRSIESLTDSRDDRLHDALEVVRKSVKDHLRPKQTTLEHFFPNKKSKRM